MAQSASNVDITTENFSIWVTKTNELREAMRTVTVTANSTLGNTSGNCHVKGYLAGNTVVACANIGGASISANSSALPEIFLANLNFITNTVHTSNTFFNTGTVVTDNAVGNHANVHTFSSNVTFSGSHVILSTSTRLFANGAMGSAAQVLSSNGTAAYWRTVTEMQLVDSVANTSITYGATANAVKTAYDTALASTFAGTRTYNANLTANGTHFIVSPTTSFFANGSGGAAGQVLTSNGTAVYWGAAASGGAEVLDSTSNTSIVYAAAANSVKTAYDTAIIANTNANTAQTMALDANTRATSAQTAVVTAQTDALNANTRAASAQTAATAAYSNAVTFSANATNLTSGTVPSGRLSGSYSISVTGSAGSVSWTNVSGRPTDLASFTNGPGYVTSSGSVAYASNSGHATTVTSVPFANVTSANAVLRHVSTGYTSSARVFVSSSTPSSPLKGDIWFQI